MDYTDHTVFINYFDRAEKLKSEEVKVCKDYLTYMAKHIVSIWEIMKKEFK